MGKDQLTEKVFQMYQEYPFPGDVQYQTEYLFPLMRFFAEKAGPGKRSILEQARVIEIGCGTGNTLVGLAEKYPSANFTGIDMTVNSLNIAQKKAEDKGLTNIRFMEKDILNLDLEEQFDVVMCIGVLHHLADMEKGLENIANLMHEDSYLILWLYGKHGRYRLNLNQQMLAVLLKNVESLSEQVAITKEVLEKANDGLMSCHFNVPNSKMEDDWEESLQFVIQEESWLVDQFLHYNEKVVDMMEIVELGNKCGLQLSKWIGVSEDIADYIPSEEVIRQFAVLEEDDQRFVLDRLLKPNYYTVALQKKGT
ncbi:class I SAM-dependent methyltransferase [Paenibacillus bouchesdurhonensis]|uniref:class I SAM-dependent methyltransferase n=1 Tax=Paenibacillus bouchesdurhonensis TaxID=1870990 RepID=UPI000DA5F740|nr:class I SAM-dependent methyltransferase [Paenibacillus bouchesdurhonensis]